MQKVTVYCNGFKSVTLFVRFRTIISTIAFNFLHRSNCLLNFMAKSPFLKNFNFVKHSYSCWIPPNNKFKYYQKNSRVRHPNTTPAYVDRTPFSYIFKNSEIREVSGWSPSFKSRIRVPHKEMLITLKVHSMRMADKRDIIMLCYEKPYVEKIIDHLKNCPKVKIIANIDELLSVITVQNLKDSLKGVYSINDKIYDL